MPAPSFLPVSCSFNVALRSEWREEERSAVGRQLLLRAVSSSHIKGVATVAPYRYLKNNHCENRLIFNFQFEIKAPDSFDVEDCNCSMCTHSTSLSSPTIPTRHQERVPALDCPQDEIYSSGRVGSSLDLLHI